MAKATHAAGDSYTYHELIDPPPAVINRPSLADVIAWQAEDGGGSTESSETESASDDNENPSHQSHALTTGLRSKPPEVEPSSADSMDGNGLEIPAQPSARPAKKAAAKRTAAKARPVTTVEFDEF